MDGVARGVGHGAVVVGRIVNGIYEGRMRTRECSSITSVDIFRLVLRGTTPLSHQTIQTRFGRRQSRLRRRSDAMPNRVAGEDLPVRRQ